MNRDSLLSKSRARKPKTAFADRLTKLVGLEPLEERKLLTTFYLNDNWTNFDNPGNPVSFGDLVQSSLDGGSLVTAVYGDTAFGIVEGTTVAGYGTIHDAIDAASGGDTLEIIGGTYQASDIVIDKSLVVRGRIVGGVKQSVITPEVTSAKNSGEFAVGSHQGFIIYAANVTIENLVVDGDGNGALGGSQHYHQGITMLYDQQDGSDYASLHDGALAPNNLGANQVNTSTLINNVEVKNVYWHGITVSGVSGATNEFNRIQFATVSNVGPDGSRTLDHIGILMQNQDQSDAMNNSVSDAGVGMASRTFGPGDWGTDNGARNRTGMRINTVTDAELQAYSIVNADGQIDIAFIETPGENFVGFDASKAIFTDPNNNAIGLYMNRSDHLVVGYESLGAKIGMKVENSYVDDLELPIVAGSQFVGPGAGVVGSVGILADNTGSPTTPASVAMAGAVIVSGFETGIKANQVNPLSEKNLILVDRALLSGNGTAIEVGNNSMLQGSTEGVGSIEIIGNGVVQPGYPESFFMRDDNTYVGPFADVFNLGDVELTGSSTLDIPLSARTGSGTMFSFDENLGSFPLSLIPDIPSDGITSVDRGTSFVLGGGSVNQPGDGNVTISGTNGLLKLVYDLFTIPNPNGPDFQLVPQDFGDFTEIEVELKVGASNQAKAILFGFVDAEADVAFYVVDLTNVGSADFSTVKINLASPGVPVELGDGGGDVDLDRIVGWTVLGDAGLVNGSINTPVNVILRDVSGSSVNNSSLNVTGSVNLNGAALTISENDLAPTIGQQFTIIDNDGADPVVGTFGSIPAGYSIDYAAGDGNDVVVTYTGATPESTIVDRHIFYNASGWDGGDAGTDAVTDEAARATDKEAYIPNGVAADPANVSSYSRGINGIMIDIDGTGDHSGITASDFVFKVGNNNSPDTWAAAPAPTAVTVFAGAGVGGSDRVEITWANGAIVNEWLEVQVLATPQTHLADTDVHFWGNKIADSTTGTGATVFQTNTTDAQQALATLTSPGNAAIDNLRDYNRDMTVNTTDFQIAIANLGTIVRLNVPGAGPFAAPAVADSDDDGDTSAVASALAVKAAPSLPKLPGWIASRLESLDLNSGPVAKLFTQLAEANTPGTRSLLLAANEVTDALDLDDSLLESLIEGMG